MSAGPPSREDLEALSRAFELGIAHEDLAAYEELVGGALRELASLDEIPGVLPAPPVRYPRGRGQRPGSGENPCNAWYWRSQIEGAPGGALRGLRVAIKDNTCVAGVPMANGSAILEGYVPDVDATVVTRVLDAGGTILGKATCEDLCYSAGSHTSFTGPVLNPHDPSRMTGGSSSGSAALVALGEADLATGSDQGGSLRIPAAWCGVVGFKPTFGLVPYSGVAPVEVTVDHYGPMASTVEGVARFLEVLAGPDGLDPRQRDLPGVPAYREALSRDVEGLRVGVLQEGFGWPDRSDPRVDRLVRASVEARFGEAGAELRDVSVPMHRDGTRIHLAITAVGAYATLALGTGMGTNWQGLYVTSLADAFARGLRERAHLLSPTAKNELLLGRYLHEHGDAHAHARAQNLRHVLRAAYDEALREHDVLAMPTVPFQPRRIPPKPSAPDVVVRHASEETANTAPFNLTGHPAISVNAGWLDGLPVGLMLVGRRWDEATVLRAAHAFEQRAPQDA